MSQKIDAIESPSPFSRARLTVMAPSSERSDRLRAQTCR